MKAVTPTWASRLLLFVACIAIFACGDDAGGITPMAGTGAGGAAGAAGATAGAGPAAGAAAMAGGPAAGSGAVGGLSCATATMGAATTLHAAAAVALLPQPTNPGCSFTSCHNANVKKANLILTAEPVNLRTQLVGKMACEVPALALVATTGGDAALANSWLWQKLTAPVDGSGDLLPKPEWGAGMTGCSQMSGSAVFGARMPYGGMLSMEKLSAVRDWICAGAPGPM
jgi:hypothetical protein